MIYSGEPGGSFSAMKGSFFYLAPVVVGCVTVYVAETKQRRTWWYYGLAPMSANIFFSLGTVLIQIEGLICLIVIMPVFMLLGALGGLMMGIICRVTKWPKHAVYSIGMLPLLLGTIPSNEHANQFFRTIERTIVVQARPQLVWHQIHNARDIKPEEVDQGWMYRIGVPLPIAGITEQSPDGLVRKITMGKSIHFDQVVTEWQENRHVRWKYRFDEDSFPPQALDDHVKIGGHYFDLIDTAYTLTPINDGRSTALTIQVSYRVSTQFNWYADLVAQVLIGNFEETILKFYQRRSGEVL